MYVVKREIGNGRPKTLHQNQLLPINFLPLDESNKLNVPRSKTLREEGAQIGQDTNLSSSCESSGDEFPIIVPMSKPRQDSEVDVISISEPWCNIDTRNDSFRPIPAPRPNLQHSQDLLSGLEVIGETEETRVSDCNIGICGNIRVDSLQEELQSLNTRISQVKVPLDDTRDSADKMEPLVPGKNGIYIWIMYITLASLYETWIGRRLLS